MECRKCGFKLTKHDVTLYIEVDMSDKKPKVVRKSVICNNCGSAIASTT